MRSRKPFLAAAAALCVMLTACASVEETSTSSLASSSPSQPASPTANLSNGGTNHIKKQLAANLSVDADVVLPKGFNASKADVLTAKYHQADTALLLKTFFSQKKIKQHTSKDGDHYQAADGSYLSNSLGSFAFSDHGKPNIHFAFFMDPQDIDDYNADKFSATSDLPFEARNSSVGRAQKTLSSFGVDVGKDYTCYSLDHQTLQKQQDAYVARQEDDSNTAKFFKADLNAGRVQLQKTWTQDDDCYYFILYPEINGIPVTRQLHGSADNGTEVEGTDITVLYDKNGIVDLQADYVYDKTGIFTKDAALINTDKALEAIRNKYGSVILSGPVTVTKMSLQYVPILADKSRKNFKLTPAWVCDIKQVYEKQNKQTGKKISRSICSEVLIDAVTGKEVL